MIEVLHLTKRFGPKVVLQDVCLKIPTGQTTCIIGRSGSGKTVLLKHIVGLLRPDSGTIWIDGQEVTKLRRDEWFQLRRRFGYVFQGAALFDSLSVLENVVIGLYEHDIRQPEVLHREAQRVLSAVGLLPPLEEANSREFQREYELLCRKYPADLSGGMRKRVGIARALVGNPEYVFYDEPTSGLDPVTSEQIDSLIAELAQRLQVTSVVITHDMFTVLRIAHRVALIDEGIIRFVGTPEEMLQSSEPIVQRFLERYVIPLDSYPHRARAASSSVLPKM
ncbi:MAG: ATP-binding cassette domain-containing protein [Candidatus Kapabacteria bacterium]|nr:ATP-binding cassette domain-containing protein [Candidatus Kapabacteria bacterium]MDW8011733.1 ATP-binding cassette domain-containing protein [Bacteroidota bacterium]